MTNIELNEYILHYLEHDKTKSAIMLTGGWGTGKSFYIQNELMPFLAQQGQKSIAVSLYGLSDLADVSKSLYIEAKASWLNKSSEAMAKGLLIAKTVIKGLAGHFNINLDPSEDDLQKFYSSVDFSGTLLVFEDIERIRFSITEFLGYINSLVEQDGIKVLLVANEQEIIRYKPLTTVDLQGKEIAGVGYKIKMPKEREYTDETKAYLISKEKTISDTLRFEGDVCSAVKSIIDSFQNDMLCRFSNDYDADEIKAIMKEIRNYNLRSFRFACQKACDIFQKMHFDTEVDAVFIKAIFLGIVAFSLRFKTGTSNTWRAGNQLSVELGSAKYPLFRFCYDYIVRHRLDESQIKSTQKAFYEYWLYDKEKSKNDPDLILLASWYTHSETEVLETVTRVTERLKNPDDISFYSYGELAYYLVKLKDVIGCDTSQAEGLLVKNIARRGNMISSDQLFTHSLSGEDLAVVNAYEQLKTCMKSVLNTGSDTIWGFSYQPDEIDGFYKQTINNINSILTAGAFASRLDPYKTVEMLKKCTAKQIDDFRSAFISVYESENNCRHLHHDCDAIEELMDSISKLRDYVEYDHIQKAQIGFFIFNLHDVLSRL